MKVRMKADISGTRNGVDWPARGEYIDLPEQEAIDLIGAGMAEPASKTAAARVETATAPADEETRKPSRAPRVRPSRAKAAPAKATAPAKAAGPAAKPADDKAE